MQHVTVTQKRVNKLAVRFALEHLHRLKRLHAEYDEEVDAWYRSGDGRSPKWHTFIEGDNVWQENVGGKGYRFPSCIHGTSLWTDYDNICGPCEDSLTVYQEALYAGHRDAQEYLNRASVWQYAKDQNVPDDICDQLFAWATDMLLHDRTPTRRNLP